MCVCCHWSHIVKSFSMPIGPISSNFSLSTLNNSCQLSKQKSCIDQTGCMSPIHRWNKGEVLSTWGSTVHDSWSIWPLHFSPAKESILTDNIKCRNGGTWCAQCLQHGLPATHLPGWWWKTAQKSMDPPPSFLGLLMPPQTLDPLQAIHKSPPHTLSSSDKRSLPKSHQTCHYVCKMLCKDLNYCWLTHAIYLLHCNFIFKMGRPFCLWPGSSVTVLRSI